MSLSKLIEAVEAGAVRPGDYGHPDVMFMEVWLPTVSGPQLWQYASEAYDGSLDAAKRLHDALLPEYGYHLGGWGARVWLYSDRPHWDGSNRQEVEMPNAPARAWLLCILRALEQEGR